MKGFAAPRRLGGSLVLALVLAALVVPAAPAAADADDFWSLVSSPVTVRRDGVDYKMQIFATETADGESVDIMLSRRRNPDGVAEATQSHYFSFDVNRNNNRFTHPETNLSRAGLDTGNEFGDYGSLDLNFNQDGALKTSCDGDDRSRVGTLSGTVNFKTQSGTFNTITNRPPRATLYFDSGERDCGFGGGGGGANACPARTRSIFGSRYSSRPFSFSVSETDGSNSASLFWSSGEALRDGEGFLSHSLFATLPASNFGVGDQLGSGTIRGAAGTWVSGTATYTRVGDTYTTPAVNCGGDKEKVSKSSQGTLTGNLAVDYFLGPDRGVGQAPMDSVNAFRWIVRMR